MNKQQNAGLVRFLFQLVLVLVACVIFAGCQKQVSEESGHKQMLQPQNEQVDTTGNLQDQSSAIHDSGEKGKAGQDKDRSLTVAARNEDAGGGGLVRVFEDVWIDRDRGIVEFAGVVPVDVHNPLAPHVFLEVLVCAPDTREHETLVMTRANPSQIHAAILMLGLKAGVPGRFYFDENDELKAVPASGDGLDVFVAYEDSEGQQIQMPISQWITHVDREDGQGQIEDARWVFAGSRFVERGGVEFYDADGAGTIVGLHTFGNEVVAFGQPMNPEASIEEPVWIANTKTVPRMGTVVRVQLRAIR